MSHTKNRKQKIENRKQKGVSILFAILIMTAILTIGLGVSVIITQQTKMLREIGYSVIAFYAADSGIEGVLYEDKLCRRPTCSTSSPPAICPGCDGLPSGYNTSFILENGASYNASYATTTKSIGSYKTIKRAIELTR